ncbi:variable surface protein Vir 12 [Plasmodium vivax Mauritania I]|uniref:Variable surface protein Vir 12 n=1 Tax=Plasmodium vivax Mauritania I TaxID=1035515 RepID=A0A0J9TBJ3_PLAVI|nr:variable surface protein Vir 12 [Plasmodium vivax Mauritania I]
MAASTGNSWDEALLHLPAYQKYKEFDSVDISKETTSQCNNLGSKEESDKTLCKKIAQNLRKLSTLQGDELKNGCYYFQHWFYEQIAKTYYDGKNKNNKYHVGETLFDIIALFISTYPKLEPCRCYVSGKPEYWEEEKYLHDYFKNYQHIKCSNSSKDRCEKYIQYVTYINRLFPAKEDTCCDEGELIEDFCKPYFNCENKFSPEKLLTQLKTELQSLGTKAEAPREGGTVGGVVDAKAKPGAAESEGAESGIPKPAAAKPAPAKPVATSPAPSERAPAKPVAAKPAATKPATTKPAKEESEGEDPAGAKPVAAKPAPGEAVPAKPVAAKPVATESAAPERAPEAPEPKRSQPEIPAREVPEQAVVETAETLQHEESLSPPPMEGSEPSVQEVSSYNSELASNGVPLTIADSPNTLGTTNEELDSNFFSNIIMAVAVLGTIFFLFYYNRSARLESSSRKKKQKKGKIFEHNYYEEYEKELPMYDSEETFVDSEMDRLYLNYHPDQDSYY